jgi:hypothetical protein
MTALGYVAHRKWHHNIFPGALALALNPYRLPEVGEDGCVEFHLWEFAQIFGAYLYNGCKPPCEMEVVVIPGA